MSLKITQLEITHPDYDANSSYWRNVRNLKEGSEAIKKCLSYYLPKRPDEDDELYTLRMAKFSYTPVMADVIGKYSAKLASSPIHLSNAQDPYWDSFRANNNHPKATVRKENTLLQEVFTSILYYGSVWVACDLLPLNAAPKSLYEYQKVSNYPYCHLYEPLEVINWGDDWVVVRHIYPLVEPFQPPKTICRWTLYQDGQNSIYEVPVKLISKKDEQGLLYDVIEKVEINGEWLPISDEKAVLEPMVWAHGQNLMCRTMVSNDKCLGRQIYLKQIQHLRIENAWTDAGYLSGVVQRLFTPPDIPPVEDYRVTYEQPDYAKELSKAGNTHILIGNGYQFVESTGAALANLEGQLDKIESQIKEIASLHFASVTKGALEQSGISKEVDMTLLEEAMQYYGQIVLSLYNNILSTVAGLLNKPVPIAVGLSSYSIDSTNELIEQLMKIEQLPNIPKTTKKIVYGKLSQLLVGTASPEDEQLIKDELEALFTAQKDKIKTDRQNKGFKK